MGNKVFRVWVSCFGRGDLTSKPGWPSESCIHYVAHAWLPLKFRLQRFYFSFGPLLPFVHFISRLGTHSPHIIYQLVGSNPNHLGSKFCPTTVADSYVWLPPPPKKSNPTTEPFKPLSKLALLKSHRLCTPLIHQFQDVVDGCSLSG